MKNTLKFEGISTLSVQHKRVVTRYAPSPTGWFHVGGARTAIFNYLFAKQNLGNFILRIEDTDLERNIANGRENQFENLKWLKIFPDESFDNPGNNGPYMQSQKNLRYQQLVDQLIQSSHAYRCFCSFEELELHRKNSIEKGMTPKYSQKCRNLSVSEINEKLATKVPFAVRLKIDEAKIYEWTDLVRGKISVSGSAMSDYVILRSNQIPTYNFAVVVDDYDMQISHVLRGEEHIANTPYQIATYHAFEWTHAIPKFGHLSILINENGKKLSKRDESVQQFIESYRSMGYVPEAVVNFLALLGWSGREDNVEIMSLDELITNFSLEHLSKAPAFFDLKKLNWMCSEYFKKMDDQTYLNFVNGFFDVDLGVLNNKKSEIALLYKNQIVYAQQLNELAADLFVPATTLSETIAQNEAQLRESITVLTTALELFPADNYAWETSTLRAYLKQIMAQTEKRGADFFMPLRLVFSLKTYGPELLLIMQLLGAEICKRRLECTIKMLQADH